MIDMVFANNVQEVSLFASYAFLYGYFRISKIHVQGCLGVKLPVGKGLNYKQFDNFKPNFGENLRFRIMQKALKISGL